MKFFGTIFTLMTVGLIAYWLWWPTYQEEFDRSALLIEKIEDFKRANGRIPNTEEALKLRDKLGWPRDESCPCYRPRTTLPYYNKEDINIYNVYFDTILGKQMIYRSTTKAWTEG